jgi:hypothetical protein
MNTAACALRKSFSIKLLYFSMVVFIASMPQKLNARNRDENAIRKILDERTEGWNNGSIEEFMKGYWQSDSLVFVGKNGLRYGYKATLENYKKSYPDSAVRGRLNFDVMKMERLSKEYYFVTGRWQLLRSIGNLEGYFTLLFKKIKNNWVIIADHSR